MSTMRKCETEVEAGDQYGESFEGQCGTCSFAAEFGYAASPSGPNDGVHCTSKDHALWMDKFTGLSGSEYNIKEYNEYGFIDLFRLECLAEPEYRCPHWHEAR